MAIIRRFLKTDIDQILDIWLKASISAHDFINKDFWESKVDDMRDIYLPSSETYVYQEKDEVKGFVSLCGETLAAVFVSPEFQGRGIGKQMIDKAKSLRSNLRLTVYKENFRSVEFYEKCGFMVNNEQIDEHTGHLELLMTFSA